MEADGIGRQIVVFANFRNEVEDFSNRPKACLDLKGHVGDVITAVVGAQFKEQKMHHAGLFLNDAPGRPPPVDEGSFDAIACLATRSIGAAGWDSPMSTKGCLRTFPRIFALQIRRKGALDAALVPAPQLIIVSFAVHSNPLFS